MLAGWRKVETNGATVFFIVNWFLIIHQVASKMICHKYALEKILKSKTKLKISILVEQILNYKNNTVSKCFALFPGFCIA